MLEASAFNNIWTPSFTIYLPLLAEKNPLEQSIEKQDTLFCKMFELKRNQFFQFFTLNQWWEKNITQVVTDTMPNPMSRNNTDNNI